MEHDAAHRTFRTCFRLFAPGEPASPVADERSPGEILPQAKDDPSVLVPAQDVLELEWRWPARSPIWTDPYTAFDHEGLSREFHAASAAPLMRLRGICPHPLSVYGPLWSTNPICGPACGPTPTAPRTPPARRKAPDFKGFLHGHGWARTSDLSRVKRYRIAPDEQGRRWKSA